MCGSSFASFHRSSPLSQAVAIVSALMTMMIEVDTWGEVNQKETKVQLTTTAGVLNI